MPESEAVQIGTDVLRSLAEAHAHGLVHRDLKPANIYLHQVAGSEPIVKVLDFGIVKSLDATMTQAGKALGTPTHMSPEQAMGRPVDQRSDLYALGVLLYECLTGRLPFDADNPLAIVMQHVTEPVPPIATRVPAGRVRPQVAAVVERALAKRPSDRWSDANAMRSALEWAMAAPGAERPQAPARPMRATAARGPGPTVQAGVPRGEMPPGRPSPGGSRPDRPGPRTGRPPPLRAAASPASAPPPLGPGPEPAPGSPPLRPRPAAASALRVFGTDSRAAAEEDATAFDRPAMPSPSPDPPERSAAGTGEGLAPPPRGPVPVAAPPEPETARQPAGRATALPGIGGAQPAGERLALRTPGPGQPTPDVSLRPALPFPGEPRPPRVHDAAEAGETGRKDAQSLSAPASRDDAARVLAVAPPPEAPPSGAEALLTGASVLGDAASALARLRGAGGGRPSPSGLAAALAATPGGSPLRASLAASLEQLSRELDLRNLRATQQRDVQVSALWLGADGRHALYADLAGRLRLVRLPAVEEQPVSVRALGDEVAVGDHPGLVSALCVSPDGRQVASSSDEGTLRLWEVAEGRLAAELGLQSRVHGLAYSVDGRLLVAGCADGTAHLIELPALETRRHLRGHRNGVTAVAAAGSRRLVVTGGEEGTVRTWDPVGGGARLTVRGHGGAVGAVAVSPDGRWVVSGGNDGVLLVLAARDGGERLRAEAHRGAIAAVAIDPTQSFVASTAQDGAARIWSLRDGRLVAERVDLTTGGAALRFAEDGRWIVVASWDGTLRRLSAVGPL